MASLLDGSTAGELIPELARHGLQQLIELEVAAVIGADRHERTDHSGSATEVGAFYWTDVAPDIVNPGREEQV